MTTTEQVQLLTNSDARLEVLDGLWVLIFNVDNLLLLGCLFLMGVVLKKSHRFPDYGILFSVWAVGAVLGTVWLPNVWDRKAILSAFMVGTMDGILATQGHQFVKHILESPYGKAALKWPLVSVVAGMIGALPTDKAKSKKTKKKVTPPAK